MIFEHSLYIVFIKESVVLINQRQPEDLIFRKCSCRMHRYITQCNARSRFCPLMRTLCTCLLVCVFLAFPQRPIMSDKHRIRQRHGKPSLGIAQGWRVYQFHSPYYYHSNKIALCIGHPLVLEYFIVAINKASLTRLCLAQSCKTWATIKRGQIDWISKALLKYKYI